MKSLIRLSIACAAILSTGCVKQYAGPTPFPQGTNTVVLIPVEAMTSQISFWGGTTFEADVETRSDGSVVVNGDPEWSLGRFPSLLKRRINLITTTKDGRVELELATNRYDSDPRVKIRVAGDLETALRAVLTTPDGEAAALEEGYRRVAREAFRSDIASLPEEVKVALVRFAHKEGYGIAVRDTTYRETNYFVVDLGSDPNVYNTLHLDQHARVAKIVNERLLSLIKAFAIPVRGVDAIGGLKVEFLVAYRNFVRGDDSGIDHVGIYMPTREIQRFTENDITSQQLMDSAIVIVNGNRISLRLN